MVTHEVLPPGTHANRKTMHFQCGVKGVAKLYSYIPSHVDFLSERDEQPKLFLFELSPMDRHCFSLKLVLPESLERVGLE